MWEDMFFKKSEKKIIFFEKKLQILEKILNYLAVMTKINSRCLHLKLFFVIICQPLGTLKGVSRYGKEESW